MQIAGNYDDLLLQSKSDEIKIAFAWGNSTVLGRSYTPSWLKTLFPLARPVLHQTTDGLMLAASQETPPPPCLLRAFLVFTWWYLMIPNSYTNIMWLGGGPILTEIAASIYFQQIKFIQPQNAIWDTPVLTERKHLSFSGPKSLTYIKTVLQL